MPRYNRIIVVDDNPAILTALKICLSAAFEQVKTLPSPARLLQELEGEVADVVLLDMNFSLGVNTGQEGLQWLHRVGESFPNVPIVLMTAYADVGLAVKAMKQGAADFVTKPWDNDQLLRTLGDAIDRSNRVDTLEDLEAQHVRRVMDHCKGNVSEAAKLLGITRQTLYTRLNRIKPLFK